MMRVCSTEDSEIKSKELGLEAGSGGGGMTQINRFTAHHSLFLVLDSDTSE